MQYLRARYYNPATGTFNRLDPFAGRMYDPQSLHKYLYVHGDPIGLSDPTGMFGLAGFSVGFSIASGLREQSIGVYMAIFDSFKAMYDGIRLRKTADQVLMSFFWDQAVGFVTGLGVGAAFRGVGSIRTNGIGHGFHRARLKNAMREFLAFGIPWHRIRPGLASDAANEAAEIAARNTLSAREAAIQAAGINAHFHGRHGAGTTIEQQWDRAVTKKRPDYGVDPFHRNSSRFLTHQDQLDAYDQAVMLYQTVYAAQGRHSFPFEMPRVIGEGFTKHGTDYVVTVNVQATFDSSTGELVTMFPLLKPLN